jgi:hypothetical protein
MSHFFKKNESPLKKAEASEPRNQREPMGEMPERGWQAESSAVPSAAYACIEMRAMDAKEPYLQSKQGDISCAGQRDAGLTKIPLWFRVETPDPT